MWEPCSYHSEEGQCLVPVAQSQVDKGGEVVFPGRERCDTQRLSDSVLGEVQIDVTVAMVLPDGHRGEERTAAVPQPLKLIVPQPFQQGAEATVVLLMQVVVVTVRVEVETPEGVWTESNAQLDRPLHEGLGALLKPSASQLLHLRLRYIYIRLGRQLLRPAPVDVFLMPVTVPLRPPKLPVDDGKTSEVPCRDKVDDVLISFEQMQIQAAVLRQPAMHSNTLRCVVWVETQAVCIEDGDILTRPLSPGAAIDVEQSVNVGADVVLDGAHVQRSVPRSDEGLSANQR